MERNELALKLLLNQYRKNYQSLKEYENIIKLNLEENEEMQEYINEVKIKMYNLKESILNLDPNFDFQQ